MSGGGAEQGSGGSAQGQTSVPGQDQGLWAGVEASEGRVCAAVLCLPGDDGVFRGGWADGGEEG